MTQTYGTQVTAYYLAAVAAYEAGGAALNISGGTLIVGDGFGVVPSISALVAANGVTHEVWRGSTIASVALDSTNSNQLDIGCVIPAAIGGVEIGPFTVTEFAILDAIGNCCVVGTLPSLPKVVSGSGATSDLAWTAAVTVGVGAVNVTLASSSFVTLSQVILGYNANLPSCNWPLTKTDTVNSLGWLNRVFGIQIAGQPAGASSTQETAAFGAGRAATAAEFAAGVAESGAAMSFPWPTLQQVKGAFANYVPIAGGTMTGALTLYGDPSAALHAASKQYVDNGRPSVVNVGLAANVALSNVTPLTVTNLTGTGNANVAVSSSALTIGATGLYHIDFNAGIDIGYSASSNYWATATVLRNGTAIFTSAQSAYFFGTAVSLVGLTGMRTLALAAGDVLTVSVETYASAFSSAALDATHTSIDITRLA